MWITPYVRKDKIKGVKSLTFFLPLALLALGFSLLPYHYITAQTTSIESHQEQPPLQPAVTSALPVTGQATLQQLSSVLQALKTLLSSLISQTQAQTSGLVGYWTFDEGSGATAADSSGNNNTGTLVNGPSWTTGKIGQALSFDGVDDLVTASGISNTPSAFTLSAWIKFSQLPDDKGIAGSWSTTGYMIWTTSGKAACQIDSGPH